MLRNALNTLNEACKLHLQIQTILPTTHMHIIECLSFSFTSNNQFLILITKDSSNIHVVLLYCDQCLVYMFTCNLGSSTEVYGNRSALRLHAPSYSDRTFKQSNNLSERDISCAVSDASGSTMALATDELITC